MYVRLSIVSIWIPSVRAFYFLTSDINKLLSLLALAFRRWLVDRPRELLLCRPGGLWRGLGDFICFGIFIAIYNIVVVNCLLGGRYLGGLGPCRCYNF